jgi:acetyltransferase-like isoleucine patch superfamily enzyme
MSRLLQLAREDGWAQLLARTPATLLRRLRDAFTARKLHAPNFRTGRSPRLLGLAHMRVGRNFSAGDHLWLEAVTSYAGQPHSPQLHIGNNVNLSDSVHIACLHRIHIGDGLLSGSRVLISDHTHGVYTGPNQSSPDIAPTRRPLSSPGEITIGHNVWLGDGVCVLAGAIIGDGAIIGANSIVRGAIPPATIAVGAPARVVRRWDASRSEWIKVDPPA